MIIIYYIFFTWLLHFTLLHYYIYLYIIAIQGVASELLLAYQLLVPGSY